MSSDREILDAVRKIHHEVDVPWSAWSLTKADGTRSSGATFIKGCSCRTPYCQTLEVINLLSRVVA